jgi:UDP-N-acetylmuramoyl-tripeptide--D-alanyl-D-alanine ligase
LKLADDAQNSSRVERGGTALISPEPATVMDEVQTSPFRPMHDLTFGEARSITHGSGVEGFESRRLGSISTDTRTLRPGETYLALRGENSDGHRYVAQAVAAGCGALIVETDFERTYDASMPVLRSADPLRAYGDLAAHQRRTWGGKVIAISGSVGKTTTRRLVAHALRRHVQALEPIRNFNNLIGVPKTLERLEANHEVLVAELGINQPGELERLTEIVEPNVAGLTRLGPTHIGMFGSMEALVEAKSSIYRCSADDAVLVANADCAWSTGAVNAHARGRRIAWFRATGDKPAQFCVENAQPLPEGGYRFDLVTPQGRVEGARIEAFGRHLLENIAAAAAFLGAAGYDPGWAVESLADFHTEPLRGQILRTGDQTLILDCYNAGFGAMVSALETLAELPRRGRTILVLADMLELGEFAVEFHDRLVEPIGRIKPDLVLALGEQFGRIQPRLVAEGIEARHFNDRDALTQELRERLDPGDLVFFKGSRRFELETVARAFAGDIPGWDGSH